MLDLLVREANVKLGASQPHGYTYPPLNVILFESGTGHGYKLRRKIVSIYQATMAYH